MTGSSEIALAWARSLRKASSPWGSLALSMIGIISLAPVLANLLRPVVVPLFSLVGA